MRGVVVVVVRGVVVARGVVGDVVVVRGVVVVVVRGVVVVDDDARDVLAATLPLEDFLMGTWEDDSSLLAPEWLSGPS